MYISHTLTKYTLSADIYSKRKQYKNWAVNIDYHKHQSLVLNALIINSYFIKKRIVEPQNVKVEQLKSTSIK